jgi:aromatic ring hydroxylase
MPPRNGAQFIDGLRQNPRETWVAGRRVDDITTDPVFRRPIRSIAQLYDLQTSSAHSDLMTYACEDTGEPAGTSFLMPRSHDDLVKRRRSMKVWADATFGMVGRSPDYLNTVLMTFAEGAEFFGQRGAMSGTTTGIAATATCFSPTPSSIRRAIVRGARTSRRTPSSTWAWWRRAKTA